MKNDFAMLVKSGSAATVSAVAGLAIAFGWPLLLTIPGVSTHQITDAHDDVVHVCAKWLVVSVLCTIAFAIQRCRLSELGIRWLGWRDFLACLGGVIIAFALSAASRFVAMPSSVSVLRWLAGLLSLILFTVSHAGLYGMSAALIVPGLAGAVLTGLYLWRHNLPSCMLMHAIIDGVMMIAIPATMQAK